jgi:hypothetical protein
MFLWLLWLLLSPLLTWVPLANVFVVTVVTVVTIVTLITNFIIVPVVTMVTVVTIVTLIAKFIIVPVVAVVTVVTIVILVSKITIVPGVALVTVVTIVTFMIKVTDILTVAVFTFVTVVTLVTKLTIVLVVAVGTRTCPKSSALRSFSDFFQAYPHILDINIMYPTCIFFEIFGLSYELTPPRKILLQKSTLRHLVNITSALYEILLEFFFSQIVTGVYREAHESCSQPPLFSVFMLVLKYNINIYNIIQSSTTLYFIITYYNLI